MRKIYKKFHIFYFQKRIVSASAKTIRGNTVCMDFPFEWLDTLRETQEKFLSE